MTKKKNNYEEPTSILLNVEDENVLMSSGQVEEIIEIEGEWN